MADYIDITTPKIESVTFTPNPVAVGGSVTVAARITEVLLHRMYPLPFQADEIASGES